MKAKVYRENGYYFNAKTGEQYLWQEVQSSDGAV